MGEVQNTVLSSSSREAGVRQASSGVGQAIAGDGGGTGCWHTTGGGVMTESTPKAGCASRKPSSTGWSGGGEGGKKSGRRLPSCFSSS